MWIRRRGKLCHHHPDGVGRSVPWNMKPVISFSVYSYANFDQASLNQLTSEQESSKALTVPLLTILHTRKSENILILICLKHIFISSNNFETDRTFYLNVCFFKCYEITFLMCYLLVFFPRTRMTFSILKKYWKIN